MAPNASCESSIQFMFHSYSKLLTLCRYRAFIIRKERPSKKNRSKNQIICSLKRMFFLTLLFYCYHYYLLLYLLSKVFHSFFAFLLVFIMPRFCGDPPPLPHCGCVLLFKNTFSAPLEKYPKRKRKQKKKRENRHYHPFTRNSSKPKAYF